MDIAFVGCRTHKKYKMAVRWLSLTHSLTNNVPTTAKFTVISSLNCSQQIAQIHLCCFIPNEISELFFLNEFWFLKERINFLSWMDWTELNYFDH